MDDRIKDLSKYRLEQAKTCIRSASILINAEDFVLAKDDVQEQIENAEKMYEAVNQYVMHRIEND